MKNQTFAVEDPPEHHIDHVSQISIGSGTTSNADRVDPSSGWRLDGLLATLGQVVAYEREDGGMALSTWDGTTTTVWAKFDVAPLPDMLDMREHMIEAVAIEQPRPAGFIMVICFAR